MSKKLLFDEFSPVSAKEWKQKILLDLEVADYNEKLVWESPEGIKVQPFYHADDAVIAPENLTSTSVWKIGQSIYADSVSLANKKTLKALQSGAESLSFMISAEEVKIQELLEDIDLDKIPIYLNMEFLSEAYIQSIKDFVGDSMMNIHLNIDPIGHLTRTGNWFADQEKDLALQEEILNGKFKNTLSVDTSLYQNAGANMVQQLAFGLAHANEYLNLIASNEKPARPIGWQSAAITFKVAVGTNYFFEIAKLRALRWLWKTLASEYGISRDCHIIAIPTNRNKTLYDYNTNMLRTTVECMAAVLGGADMVENRPYDAIYHNENEFGNRIALNQLLLLKNESYLDKVENPADGSYYIEDITNQLAKKALVLFKSIENEGGFIEGLKANSIQKQIQESAQKEQTQFNEGDEVLVGTNKYQNENDKMKDVVEKHPFRKPHLEKTLIHPILEKRLAEEMEQKRLEDE